MRHYLNLRKDNENYVFLYEKGNEHEIISAIFEMIFDENLDFGWPDATILAFDMIDKLLEERVSQ